VWLASVSFVEQTPLEAPGDAQYGIKFSHTATDSDDRSTTIVRLSLQVEWLQLPDGTETAPLELSLDIAGAFTWQNTGLDDDLRQSWIDLNATYLLWPYARNYIALITGASSLPPLTIYTMRVPQIPLATLEEVSPASKPSGRPGRQRASAPQTARPARRRRPPKN
jgi:preprotein translocase subunit SecB